MGKRRAGWDPPTADSVRALRKDVLGWGSQEVAARELGMSTRHYAEIEAGTTDATISETAWRLMVCLARAKNAAITIEWRAA